MPHFLFLLEATERQMLDRNPMVIVLEGQFQQLRTALDQERALRQTIVANLRRDFETRVHAIEAQSVSVNEFNQKLETLKGEVDTKISSEIAEQIKDLQIDEPDIADAFKKDLNDLGADIKAAINSKKVR